VLHGLLVVLLIWSVVALKIYIMTVGGLRVSLGGFHVSCQQDVGMAMQGTLLQVDL
jgi:hypothetical protein